MITLGVLLSGGGTNLQAILDAIAAKRLDARVAVVLSNKAGAGGLDRAKRAGVPTVVLDPKAYATREAFDEAVVQALGEHGVQWVVLAGFMRIVTRVFLDAFPGRVVNIHPSLLPSFPGIDAQRQAFDYGVRITGCTVHFVDTGTDTGPIIAQRAVPVLAADDVESLKARILVEEHRLLPEVLQWIAEGRVSIEEGKGRARVMVSSVSRESS
jgi:phosphoribosylglycinamide formyltransferase-1